MILPAFFVRVSLSLSPTPSCSHLRSSILFFLAHAFFRPAFCIDLNLGRRSDNVRSSLESGLTWGARQRQAIDSNRQKLLQLNAMRHKHKAADAMSVAQPAAQQVPVPPPQSSSQSQSHSPPFAARTPELVVGVPSRSVQTSVSSSGPRGRTHVNRQVNVQRHAPQAHNQPRTTRTKFRFRNTIINNALKPSVLAPVYTGWLQSTTSTHTMPPKTPIVVTSLAPLTKTFTLKHGFRTSEAVVTTSAFMSSTVQPDQYELSLHPTNSLVTLTILSKETDAIVPTRVTHLLVTTASLQEIKLVPIKIGFSTRTNTVTSVHVLTTVSKLVLNSAPLSLPAPLSFAPPALTMQPTFKVLVGTTTIVSTSTITSTTVASLVFHGQTFVSTGTQTSLSETTITATLTQTVPLTAESASLSSSLPTPALPAIPSAPSILTTLITFQLTDDAGDVTEIVTPVTVPIEPSQRARAKRAVSRIAPTRSSDHLPTSATHSAQPLSHSLSAPPSPLPHISASFSPLFAADSDPLTTHPVALVPQGPAVQPSPVHKIADNGDIVSPGDTKPIDEDKYATGGFQRRRLHQFGSALSFSLQPQSDNFFRDFGRVVPLQSFPGDQAGAITASDLGDIDEGALVAAQQPPQANSQPFGGRQGSFQRIRLNGNDNPFNRLPAQPSSPQAAPVSQAAGFVPVGDNSPFSRFQRVVVQKLPETPLREPSNKPQGGFRRLPVFSPQLTPPLQPLSNPAVVVVNPADGIERPNTLIDAPAAVPVTRPQSQSNRPFRRVRPGQAPAAAAPQGNRRVRPAVRNRDRVAPPDQSVAPPPTRSPPPTSAPFTPSFIEVTTETATESTVTESTEHPTTRRIVRIRKPPTSPSVGSSNRRRVVMRGRPTTKPIVEEEPSRNNALENSDDGLVTNFGNRLKDEPAGGSPQLSKVSPLEPSVPLTYFTTYTYLTTVLRGPHTLITSRESVTSSVATQALDGSVIDLLQHSGVLIAPTATRSVSSRTKGK